MIEQAFMKLIAEFIVKTAFELNSILFLHNFYIFFILSAQVTGYPGGFAIAHGGFSRLVSYSYNSVTYFALSY